MPVICPNCMITAKQVDRPCTLCGYLGQAEGFATFVPVPDPPLSHDAKCYAAHVSEQMMAFHTSEPPKIN